MKIDKELMTKIYDLRHRLHGIPEASMHETQTKAVLMSFLRENTDLEIVDRGVWFYAVLKSSYDRIGDEERPPIGSGQTWMQCVGRMENRDITAGMMDTAAYCVGLRPGCPVLWRNAEIRMCVIEITILERYAGIR